RGRRRRRRGPPHSLTASTPGGGARADTRRRHFLPAPPGLARRLRRVHPQHLILLRLVLEAGLVGHSPRSSRSRPASRPDESPPPGASAHERPDDPATEPPAHARAVPM